MGAYTIEDTGRNERPIATYHHIHLIYNPTAGRLQRGRGSLIRRIAHLLEQPGTSVAGCPTSAPGHATVLAREAVAAGADLVVVAGGDGTINETLNGLVGRAVPLAVLPLGTANVLATEMGLPKSPIRAVASLPALVPNRISVGHIQPTGAEPRHFLLMAGVGLDAHIVGNVDLDLKKHLGKLAYWVGGFSQLGRKFPQFEVTANGDSLDSSFALVSRVRNYGGDLEIARSASLLDDHFEMVAFEGQDSFRYLKYLTGVLANSLDKMKGVSIRKVREVEFRAKTDSEIFVQVDGELAGQVPATVKIVPDALTLLMPPSIHDRYATGR